MPTEAEIELFKKAFRKSTKRANLGKKVTDDSSGPVVELLKLEAVGGVLEQLEKMYEAPSLTAIDDVREAILRVPGASILGHEAAMTALGRTLDELAATLRLEDNLEQAGVSEPVRVEALKMAGRKTEWRAGKVAVTDLTRFPQCLPRIHHPTLCACKSKDYRHCEVEPGAKLAEEASDEYVKVDGNAELYYRPTTGAPKSGEAFLNQWEKRQEALAQGKLPASECSNFSYDAIAECLLNDELRDKYDILQAGTMDNAHNIAILVPKGQGATYGGGDEELPDGALIIDPWALAMGQDADASLFAPPDKFAYRDYLYPLDVNFNSAVVPRQANPFAPKPKSIETSVREFKQRQALKRFYDSVGTLLPLDKHGAGKTSEVSEGLAKVIRSALALPVEGTTVHSFEMGREAGILSIVLETTGEGRITLDDQDFLARCVI